MAQLGCAPRQSSPAPPVVRLLVTGSLGDSAMLRCAKLVRQLRKRDDCLWLVAASGVRHKPAEVLTDGKSAADRLGVLQVDAVLFGPDWLAWGPDRAKALADGSSCFILGSAITDTLGEPLGHGLMTRPTRLGTIGIAGLTTDTVSPLLRQRGVRIVAAAYSASAVLALLRQRCDLTILLTEAAFEPADGWDLWADRSADSVVLFEISRPGPEIRVRRLVPRIDTLEIDSAQAARLVQLNLAAEERLLATRAKPTGGTTFATALARRLLDAANARYLLAASPLWMGETIPTAFPRRLLTEKLAFPGRWIKVHLSSRQRRQLAAQHSLTVIERPGMSPSARGTEATLLPLPAADWLTAAGVDYELTAVSLWELAEELLTGVARQR